MQLISSGAESHIYTKGQNVLKSRIPKNYRIPEIDNALRASRTKREIKILDKLRKIGIPVPAIVSQTDTDIEMQHIPGKQLKVLVDAKPELALHVGKQLARMHDHNIIHGDLTTSNMILHEKEKTLYFIDFGLSFTSTRIEDKAVDIHLFKQALESKHFRVEKKAYAAFLKGYHPKERAEILKRLDEVEARGRYKEKI